MTTLILDNSIISKLAKDIALSGDMDRAFRFLTEGIKDISTENAYSILYGNAFFSGDYLIIDVDESYKSRLNKIYTI